MAKILFLFCSNNKFIQHRAEKCIKLVRELWLKILTEVEARVVGGADRKKQLTTPGILSADAKRAGCRLQSEIEPRTRG